MDTTIVYDILGIGIGPFNLSLAAIMYDLPELTAVFIEQRPGFDWHPGLLLPGARMQVTASADLVTLLNPQNPFTYHNFLQKNGRFLRHANQENSFPLRVEYNRYCQWVAGQLTSLRFNEACMSVSYHESTKVFTVVTSRTTYQARHLVIGTGTVPYLPAFVNELDHPNVIHASDYLLHKQRLLQAKKITVVGSGQSAAEIVSDLLPAADIMDELSWFTRSSRFHPMDYSRFTTEMTSVDYMDHFYALGPDTKAAVLKEQAYLYKGINEHLISHICTALYERETSGGKDNIQIRANCELTYAAIAAGDSIRLTFRHRETNESFIHDTDVLIMATGYFYKVPAFLQGIRDHIQWQADQRYEVNRNYSIDRNNRIFVQNADLHSHGFNSADLGLGPYRNATILNAILNRAHFIIERNTGFQTF